MGIELKGLRQLNKLDNVLRNSDESPSHTDSIVQIKLSEIIPGKYQPRSVFNDETLIALTESIKENGIIQPIIIRKLQDHRYEIIAGERRWRSAKLAGFDTVPAIIKNVPDEVVAAFAIVENVQREDLNPIDQAVGLSKLYEEFSMTHEKISKIVGFSRSTVSNLLRLLFLPEDIKALLKNKKIDIGHAKLLLTLNEESKIFVASEIIKNNFSVREAENFIKKIRKKERNIEILIEDIKLKEEIFTNELGKKLNHKVNVKINKKNQGKVEIFLDSIVEIESLIKRLYLTDTMSSLD